MIFLGLGSNLGDKIGNLYLALDQLNFHGVQIIRRSSFYRSPPWGITNQDDFVNLVCQVECKLTPIELLDTVLAIENDMGRVRQIKWGPRLIDIDIVEYNSLTIDTPRLQLPHPYYTIRDFVLGPLAELYPDYLPTGFEQTVTELLEKMEKINIEKIAG